jgi:hypothetical protein
LQPKVNKNTHKNLIRTIAESVTGGTMDLGSVGSMKNGQKPMFIGKTLGCGGSKDTKLRTIEPMKAKQILSATHNLSETSNCEDLREVR